MGYSAKRENFHRGKRSKDGSGGSVDDTDDGVEFVLPSELDEGLTFFVSAPKKKTEKPKGKAAPTEPDAADD